MAKETKKQPWRQIFDVRKKSDGSFYASFKKGVKITFEDKEVDLGQYGTTPPFKTREKAEEDLDFRVEKGWMQAEVAEKVKTTFEEKNVRYVVEMPIKE